MKISARSEVHTKVCEIFAVLVSRFLFSHLVMGREINRENFPLYSIAFQGFKSPNALPVCQIRLFTGFTTFFE